MSEHSSWSSSGQDPAVLKCFAFFDEVFSGSAVGPFAIRLWDGAEWRHGSDSPRFTLELKQPAALRRFFWHPTELSLGEGYLLDDFDLHGDLESAFELGDHLLSRNWRLREKVLLGGKLLNLAGPSPAGDRRGAAALRGPAHSKRRDAQAIRYHYDVSNDFYRLWLDRRMVYSCAFFHRSDDDLDQAQERKLDYLCRKLRLRPGERLLDIGCGWGGLILHAAEKYDVEALGITLSQPQADLANERIRRAGLTDRCRAEVCDYRDVPFGRPFDKLVSVGMFEHVGRAKLPEYFRQAHRLLKPGGVFLNHGITEAMGVKPAEGGSFIDMYVFPDGDLMPISTSLAVAEESGFEVRDVENLREHYALTLRHWVRRLEGERERAVELTCPVTYRVWRLYMAGSAHRFETGQIGLHQALLVKSGRRASGLPLTRCDWYRPCPNGHP